MSDPVILAIVAAVQAIGVAWLNHKSKERNVITTAKLEEVHAKVNGQTAALMKVTGESERAKGNLEGRAAQVVSDKAAKDA